LTDKWYLRPQVLIAAGVFALTLGIYAATLAPTTSFWDCGEFITTSHIVGIPHQPGTPLYVLVGRVFDILLGNADITEPALRTAWAVNFMSAFFSALAVMFVYLIIWELGRRADPDSGWLPHAGGVVGAFFLAFSQTFWGNAVEAEVYGLSAFMLGLVAWLAIRWYDHREQSASDKLLLLMIYLLGLGVGFHLGSLLVYPGIFLMVLLARDRQLEIADLMLMSAGLAVFLFSTTTRNSTVVILLLVVYLIVVVARSFQGKHFALVGSALFFVGLTVHVMMLIRAGASPEPAVNQTAPDNFATLMTVIRREQYPPLNPFHRQAPLVWQYGYYYKFLFQQFYFLGPGHGMLTAVSTVLGPIFLALVGLFHGLRRIRPLVLVPLTGYLINGEILTLYLNFTNHEVRDRDYFYFAAFMFFAVFIGLGAAALMRFAAGGEGKSANQLTAAGQNWSRGVARVKLGALPLVTVGVLLVISLLPVTPGHTKYFEHDRSENRIAYEYAWNILAGLDENAILFTNGDNDTFPIWYLQQVEHFRTDVTVVNLSLVNLPWYIKQLKHAERPLAMRRTDEQVDELRHRRFDDPNTGETTIIMIKDYVVHDIIVTNHQTGGDRPVFFAVTIPRDNMVRYFPMLQMEGMAYRLLDDESEDKLPRIDPQRVLENMLGVYSLDALTDGDTARRQSEYAAMAGLVGDDGQPLLGRTGREMDSDSLEKLVMLVGGERRDVYRNTNARHLLGNYPAALNRTGVELYNRASQVAYTDTVAYRQYLGKALTALEASMAIIPFNDASMLEFYPLLLVQAYRDEDAKTFLSTLHGNVPVDVEERTVYNALRGITRAGLSSLALEWLDGQIVERPDTKFYYEVQFSLYQALDDIQGAMHTMELWEQRSGARDEAMARGVEEMRAAALDREQQRIEDAVGGSDGQ